MKTPGRRNDGPSSKSSTNTKSRPLRHEGITKSLRARILVLAVLAVVALAAFWPVLSGQFLQWDDPSTLSQNPDLNPPTLSKTLGFWDWSRPRMDLYVPLTYTVWAGLASFARVPLEGGPRSGTAEASVLDPRVFHAANLALHVLAAFVVFAILIRLLGIHTSLRLVAVSEPRSGQTRRLLDVDPASALWSAALGAALFAVHPIQVEAVAWASGLKDVLSGVLSLVAVWLYLESKTRTGKDGAPNVGGAAITGVSSDARSGRRRRAPSGWLFAAATLSFVLAVLAKPSAVVTPLIAGVLVLYLERETKGPITDDAAEVDGKRTWASWLTLAGWRRRLAPLAPLGLWLALSLPLILVARRAQPANWGFSSPVWARPFVALDALAFYLYKLMLPLDLGLDYGRSPDWLVTSRQIWWTWLVPVAAGLVVWALRRRTTWVVAASLVFMLSLLPVLGLVRFDFQRHSTVADHYLYVAMLGPALVIASIAALRPRREQAVLAVLVLTPLAVMTYAQSGYWHDTVTLMSRTLTVNPSSPAAHINLGHIAYSQRRIGEAIEHYEAALATRPDDLKAHNNLGNALLKVNRPAEALDHFLVTLEGQPDNPGIHFNIGNALRRLGRDDEAVHEYEESLRLRPDDASVHVNLATLLLEKGQPERAAEHFREALRIEPNAADAKQGLARAMARQSR